MLTVINAKLLLYRILKEVCDEYLFSNKNMRTNTRCAAATYSISNKTRTKTVCRKYDRKASVKKSKFNNDYNIIYLLCL